MFFVLEITNTKQADGTIKTEKGVYNYDTLNLAKANFHSKLGVQMKAEACAAELVMVIDDAGAVYASEKYTKPAEPETEA